MQVLPSKELLSEVLDKGKVSITKIEYNPSKTIVGYEQLERSNRIIKMIAWHTNETTK